MAPRRSTPPLTTEWPIRVWTSTSVVHSGSLILLAWRRPSSVRSGHAARRIRTPTLGSRGAAMAIGALYVQQEARNCRRRRGLPVLVPVGEQRRRRAAIRRRDDRDGRDGKC